MFSLDCQVLRAEGQAQSGNSCNEITHHPTQSKATPHNLATAATKSRMFPTMVTQKLERRPKLINKQNKMTTTAAMKLRKFPTFCLLKKLATAIKPRSLKENS